MAYGLLLYKELTTPLGDQRLEIYKDGFVGSATEIVGLHRDGIAIAKDSSSLTQAITTSVLTIRLSDTEEIDYTQFFTPNATLFKVVWKTDDVTRWTGFITPDSFSENLAYRDTLTLTARDNLGRLGDYDFDMARGQLVSVRSILTQGLTKAGVAMAMTVSTTKVATSPATTLAIDGLVNTSLVQGMTWREALELLLTGLGLTLAWNDGNTFDLRDISKAPATSQTAFFINKSGYRQIRPAWKNLTVEQDYGLRDNFYEGQFSREDCGDGATFTPPAGGRWNVGGSLVLLNPYNGAAYPYETLYLPIQGGDSMTNRLSYSFFAEKGIAPIKMSFRANNTAWIWQEPADAFGFVGINDRSIMATSQSGGTYRMTSYYIRFRCNVFCTVGSTTYILRDSWQEYDPNTIAEPYLYFVMPSVVDEYGRIVAKDQDNEVTIYLGQLPGSGAVSLVFYQPVLQTREDGDPTDIALATLTADSYTTAYAKVTGITLAMDDGIAGRNKLVTVNAEHNVQHSLSFAVGQVPEGKGNTLLYLGGLFADDTYNTPLKEWTLAGGSQYDLLELVAREHITYNNAAYDALSGTMMAEGAFDFSKAISFGGKTYRIVGASLAILSNTLSAQILQEEAPFATDAYTIEDFDVEGSGRSGTAGGGVAQGAGGCDSRYFAPVNDGEGTLVGAKALYDLHIIQEEADEGEGTPEVTKNITEILRHLALRVIDEGQETESTILVTDLTFASLGNIVAGGIGGGGEPGGGGSIAGLSDVTLTNLTGGDILRYDAFTSHWVNEPIALSLGDLTDVALGTPSSGQALVYDSTEGKWKPGNVGGGGSAVVVDGSATIGTSYVTLATIDGQSISAKIAAYLLASDFTASNIISTLANNAVNRAKADESGNNIKASYGASLNYANDRLHLVNANNTSISYLTGANLVTVIGTTAVNRATNDANGKTIASQEWVTNKGYLTSVAFSNLTSHPTTLSGYGITDAKIASGTITLGSNSITPLTSVAFSNLTSHPTTLSGYGITDAKIASGTITLGSNSITPLTSVTVVSGDNEIGTSLTTIGQVQGVNIRAKIAAYLLASDFTASNIVSTLGNTAVNRATADASGNTITSSYLRKNTDDTMAGNLTIGQANTTGSKTLTIYGRNNSTTPALSIIGVASATTRYTTNIYRDADYLQITSAARIDGNLVVTGNVVAGSVSDRRLKRSIHTIATDAVDVLWRLHPVEFEWSEKAGKLGGLSGVSHGFIADEYNAIIPNATRKIWGDYDAIDYLQVIPYLVAGWKQQQRRIHAMDKEIKALRRRLGDVVQ